MTQTQDLLLLFYPLLLLLLYKGYKFLLYLFFKILYFVSPSYSLKTEKSLFKNKEEISQSEYDSKLEQLSRTIEIVLVITILLAIFFFAGVVFNGVSAFLVIFILSIPLFSLSKISKDSSDFILKTSLTIIKIEDVLISIKSTLNQFDAFFSYATDDEDVALPIVQKLKEFDLKVWFAKFELNTGDDLDKKINLGISRSNCGIALFSHYYFKSFWAMQELGALLASKKEILPIWHNITLEEIVKKSPLIANKIAINTQEGIDMVARKIFTKIKNINLPNGVSVDLKNNNKSKLYQQVLLSASEHELKIARYEIEALRSDDPQIKMLLYQTNEAIKYEASKPKFSAPRNKAQGCFVLAALILIIIMMSVLFIFIFG